MPNWVTNELTITGPADVLDVVGARLRAPFTRTDDNGTEMIVEQDLSFWNIIKPEEAQLAEYFGKCDDKGMKNRNNWYNWNMRNWGVKWDARVSHSEIDKDRLFYEFDTAWGAPISAMEVLSDEFPDVELSLRYTEEQGWGGVVYFEDGNAEESESWDIPETHEEAVKVFGACHNCDQEEYKYEDCPQ